MARSRFTLLLFLVALILPCVVLAFVGWQSLAQNPINQTLRSRSRYAIASALFGTLESIMVRELAGWSEGTGKYSDRSVVLVTSLDRDADRNTLVLPRDFESSHQIQYAGATERNLWADLKKDFPSDLKHGEWKAYRWAKDGSHRFWLSVTPPAGDSERQLLIAVRSEDIVERVRQERNTNAGFQASDFKIEPIPPHCAEPPPTPKEKEQEIIPVEVPCADPLDKKFPELQIALTEDPGFQEGLELFYVWVVAVVIASALLSGFFIWRDAIRKIHIADTRTHFVSNVSHELRTPLTRIRMFAETLQTRGSTNPKMQEEYLDTIVQQTERLTRLVNDVLDFSSIENGQKYYHLALHQLSDVVQSAADTMRFMLEEQKFSLGVDICEGLPPMLIDRDAMERAVLNLLSNAMKYSGSSRAIALRLIHDDGDAIIEVVDHGPGIAAKELNRIFEKFYRVTTPENRAITGTGLGLAIVAHIAAGHGGSVSVQSTPEQGTTFAIRVPVNGKSPS